MRIAARRETVVIHGLDRLFNKKEPLCGRSALPSLWGGNHARGGLLSPLLTTCLADEGVSELPGADP